ncbi:phosphate regulon transcriptional regulator PhoB [Alphaproteobacteria bacterium]|nr:phosphate regulon transcriptional regulator PhoB [Alphaproteobacteria bacterium]HCL48676.1 phosphate regulon transcriptional regulatory protein PhoB [Rhodobiaceae bacterium]MDA8624232.1 phosphate regulon transcriptional regulator PhoB [Alphaproteobacteria bacterium]MDA8624603.1 phosphate regulon transcriptional regulator PhoB [Alphaproteobacteria bacterium]MDA8780555.1 phosphate regulon transcriptional regulator PhoB [Alphaproteobacteria bacterium]|tara:strand:- start:1128 stop:1832 length:705 start_codon:yes stop_codon:yes gene_type:complete
MSATILIVDDEPAQLELLRYNLEKAGFETVQADNGLRAIDLVEDTDPDLVVLDWMMPEASGVDVCRELRARASTRLLPIIMLSARGEEGDRALGLDTGADDYITKPFSPRELVARVKALLRRARPSLLQDVMQFEDLTLNPDTMRVERDGDRIYLGPKEFRLLSVLMERPERVFSREQLLDKVWGHGIYVEDRTVDVHMSRLRRALNKRTDGGAARRDIIRTVRGTGYSLTRPN